MRVMFCLGLTLLGASFAQSQTDSCTALLAGGAFKTTSSDGTVHTYNSAKDWFCSSDFSTYSSQKKTSASGSVIIPGIDLPVGASYDDSDVQDQQKRQQFCSDSSKTFSKDEEQFIVTREGDKTIVDGFVQCEDSYNNSKGYLRPSIVSHSSGIFEIDITSQGYPGAHPFITEVRPVTGADTVLADDFTAGTMIPATGTGVGPLVGTYSFKETAQQAVVLVRTTIGSRVLTAKRCPNGLAGSYVVRQDVQHTTPIRMADYRYDFAVTQSSCHPHCGGGDPKDFPLSVGLDVTLRNPKIYCAPDGGRAECPLDPMSVDQVDGQTLQVHVVSRTVGLPFRVVAEQWSNQTTSIRTPISTAVNIQYFQPFSVSVPSDGSGDILVNGTYGSLVLDRTSLGSGDPAAWLVLQGSPITGGTSTTYTLMAKPPGCVD
jgi:hypothetical protein